MRAISHFVTSSVTCCGSRLISALLGEVEFGQHRNAHRYPSPCSFPPVLQSCRELSTQPCDCLKPLWNAPGIWKEN